MLKEPKAGNYVPFSDGLYFEEKLAVFGAIQRWEVSDGREILVQVGPLGTIEERFVAALNSAEDPIALLAELQRGAYKLGILKMEIKVDINSVKS